MLKRSAAEAAAQRESREWRRGRERERVAVPPRSNSMITSAPVQRVPMTRAMSYLYASPCLPRVVHRGHAEPPAHGRDCGKSGAGVSHPTTPLEQVVPRRLSSADKRHALFDGSLIFRAGAYEPRKAMFCPRSATWRGSRALDLSPRRVLMFRPPICLPPQRRLRRPPPFRLVCASRGMARTAKFAPETMMSDALYSCPRRHAARRQRARYVVLHAE